MKSLALDGFCLREMWAGGGNSRTTLMEALSNGQAFWLGTDTDIVKKESELWDYVKANAKRVNFEMNTAHRMSDLCSNFGISDEELDDFISDYKAIAIISKKDAQLVTAGVCAAGQKRLKIAENFGLDAECWTNIFK